MSEENISTLKKLGLSSVEAKTYLTVIKLQSSTPTIIAKQTSIARTDVYRVLTKLENLGLIEKTIEKPNVIKAIPLKKALKYLVSQKKKENAEAQIGIQNIISDYAKYEKVPEVTTFEPEFILLPKNELYTRKISDEIDNSKKCISFIFSLKKYEYILNEVGDKLIKALKRNVQIKIVTENPPKSYTHSDVIKKIQNHPLYEVKYRKRIRIGFLSIFDGHRIIMDTKEVDESKKGPALWSNNYNIVELAQCYFENRNLDEE